MKMLEIRPEMANTLDIINAMAPLRRRFAGSSKRGKSIAKMMRDKKRFLDEVKWWPVDFDDECTHLLCKPKGLQIPTWRAEDIRYDTSYQMVPFPKTKHDFVKVPSRWQMPKAKEGIMFPASLTRILDIWQADWAEFDKALINMKELGGYLRANGRCLTGSGIVVPGEPGRYFAYVEKVSG